MLSSSWRNQLLLCWLGMLLVAVFQVDGLQLHFSKHRMARLSSPLLLRQKHAATITAHLIHASPVNSIIHTRSSYMSLSSSRLQDLVPASNKARVESPQFVFVGGKGGVGKTSTSSAIALKFSDSGLRTLIVSTDPAHSLGDALDVDLSSGKLVPILTEQNLFALELDIKEALAKLRSLGSLSGESIAKSLGISKEMIDAVGIDDIASIFANPPPGIDEIIALTQIFKYADINNNNDNKLKFDRIVIDTAPTGHTLRLLQLPDFLGTVITKIIRFRDSLNKAMDTFKSFFGGGGNNGGAGGNDANEVKQLLDSVETLQKDIISIRKILKDAEQTQFVVVTIPTKLALDESKRLIQSLETEKIRISSIICNQIIDVNADVKYVANRIRAQGRSITNLQHFIEQEINPHRSDPLEICEVPYVETEVTGIYGLRFFHALAHKAIPKSASNPSESKKLTIFGGKGGVGKTTSSSSWAVKLADHGYRTLLVSTDPAHSIGDALQESLSGTPRLIDRTVQGGQLWAMEIDPMQALQDFRDLLGATDSNIPPIEKKPSLMSSFGLPNFSDELKDLLLDVENPPPGTDEIVAMTKVISYLDNGITLPDGSLMKFDRIVLDTAPTGHTLRMLELPKFMQDLMTKFQSIKEKTGSLDNMFGGSSGDVDDYLGGLKSETKQDKIKMFQEKMKRLDELLHNEKESEFTIVTIPTELAGAESKRLLSSLDKSGILVRRILINQVLPHDSDVNNTDEKTQRYLQNLRNSQSKAIVELESISKEHSIPLLRVPYFDTEVRTVYGLRAISQSLFPPQQ